MVDLSNDIRLAVDSGKVVLGLKEVEESIRNNTAKLVVIASINKKEISQDIMHVTGIANIKTAVYDGNSVQLGAVCGKPYSVSVLSVIEPGNSKILEM
jgi:large subunit ribosomal protein L30e